MLHAALDLTSRACAATSAPTRAAQLEAGESVDATDRPLEAGVPSCASSGTSRSPGFRGRGYGVIRDDEVVTQFGLSRPVEC
jgi:hypothetical protein